MLNEVLFFASLAATFGAVVAVFRLFGRSGLFAWSAFATVFANIEVVKTIELFGFETTLGNVMFGTTFFVTDILSECYGRSEAKKCVYLSLAMMVAFVTLVQFTLGFQPAPNDFASPHFAAVFAFAPRVMIASITLYFLASLLDVTLYHAIWRLTGGGRRLLWLRNNLATMISQAVQQLVFAFCIFYGVEGFDTRAILEIGLVTTVVVMVIAVADTPFIYLARKIWYNTHQESKEKNHD